MYCTNCGKQLNQNDKYCANCGTKTSNKNDDNGHFNQREGESQNERFGK